MKLKKITKQSEFYIFLIILFFSMLVQFKSGQFFTGNNIVDLVRALSIPAMFCIGEMFVLISRDTDISFPAIASLSMYIVCSQIKSDNPLVYFIAAILIGLAAGAINGFIIAKFKFPALIVTLGTSSICFGIMQGVFKSREYPLNAALYRVGEMKIFEIQNAETGLNSDMPISFIIMILVIVFGWFILNKTMLGRGIYAIGGDPIAAERAGFNVFWIKMFIYMFSGAMAGMIGVLRATMLLAVHPNNLIGMELVVIAACVLGGVRITGGKGTVTGAVLGMILLTIINNSLILLGISTHWQKFFTGAIILIGTGLAVSNRKKKKTGEKIEGKTLASV